MVKFKEAFLLNKNTYKKKKKKKREKKKRKAIFPKSVSFILTQYHKYSKNCLHSHTFFEWRDNLLINQSGVFHSFLNHCVVLDFKIYMEDCHDHRHSSASCSSSSSSSSSASLDLRPQPSANLDVSSTSHGIKFLLYYLPLSTLKSIHIF